MGNSYLPVDLNEEDELLHSPTSELKWRESYYFNWADIDNKISGFSTIGIVPNDHRREFVFLLFLEDRNEVYYKEPPLKEFNTDINEMLKTKNLSYKLIEPLKKWEIKYKSRKVDLDIVFESRFPLYNFGTDSSKSWHQHFESSGIINGKVINQDGESIRIKGYGQRDKSWGYRDWHQFDKWYAGHFQFKDWSGAFRKDLSDNKIDLSGHISTKKGNVSISSMEIKTQVDYDTFNSPLITKYEFTDTMGKSYKIRGERFKKDSFIRFVRNFDDGDTELFEQMAVITDLNSGETGVGMMEHLRTHKNE